MYLLFINVRSGHTLRITDDLSSVNSFIRSTICHNFKILNNNIDGSRVDVTGATALTRACDVHNKISFKLH